MDNIATIFNHKTDPRTFLPAEELLDPFLRIGVEVELENIVLDNINAINVNPFWHTHFDSSLRGDALELRFTFPLNGSDVLNALTCMDTSIRQLKDTPILSDRTSTHIHLDACNLSPTQLYNWIIVYLVCERLLYNYAGNKRSKSIFCVPLYSAVHNLSSINSLITSKYIRDTFKSSFNENFRYSGLNLNALLKFGSLEFRMLDGEYRKHKLLLWINILIALRNYAISMEEPINIFVENILHGNGAEKMQEIFGELYEVVNYPQLEMHLIWNSRLALEIILNNKIKQLSWEVLQNISTSTLTQDYSSLFKEKHPKLFGVDTTKEKKVEEELPIGELFMEPPAPSPSFSTWISSPYTLIDGIEEPQQQNDGE